MTTVTKAALAALIALTLFAPGAYAQEPRFRVSFAPAVATVSDDAELALGGSFGYRFSEHFWFEGELTWIDAAAGGFGERYFDVDPRTASVSVITDALRRSPVFGRNTRPIPGLPILPILPIFPPGGRDRLIAAGDGSTLIGTLGVRYELPVDTARFRPYIAGGLGINNTDQELDIDPRILAAFSMFADQSFSHTGYAFTAGAGASVRLVSQLWADMDARYVRLSRDRDIMRLGGGVSFRF